ncbi:MAG TPA: pyridoxamine 5'-phosphate oxidase family protein, partial [Limnochordia bacterium]
MSTATPEARELERRDVCAILARNITGRIAFARNGEIEIRPIRYVYADGSLYLRSAPDTALSEIGPHGTRVGFEVDE